MCALESVLDLIYFASVTFSLVTMLSEQTLFGDPAYQTMLFLMLVHVMFSLSSHVFYHLSALASTVLLSNQTNL